MKALELKVSRIGNSRGIRLPAPLLKRYGIEDSILLEKGDGFLVLRPKKARNPKLSLKETAREMAQEHETWGDFDTTLSDGLDTL